MALNASNGFNVSRQDFRAAPALRGPMPAAAHPKPVTLLAFKAFPSPKRLDAIWLPAQR
ncbi:hypothetical protein ACIBL3_39185 [Kribbella sp. NPDC050124]|uniref:hypothetical protein n=1 Tax=Kribbella sp. NPDC050124 TaxID=3364114 RepID=UPI00379F4A7A